VAPQIEFSFQLTEKDIAAVSDIFPFSWRWSLRPGIAVSIFGVLGGAVVILLQPRRLGIEFPDWLVIDVVVTAVGLMLICWAILLPRVRKWVGVHRFRRSPIAQKKMTYQVFDDHIKVMTELGYSDLLWEAFLKAKERRGYLCLYNTPLTGFVIPLGYLTPSQVSQLRDLVTNRVRGPSPRNRSFLRRWF
jgi:hypothetical protein